MKNFTEVNPTIIVVIITMTINIIIFNNNKLLFLI